MLVVLLGAALAGVRQAAAQVDDTPPSTITLDRMDDRTRIGLQVGFDKIDETAVSDGFVMRYEPYFQFRIPSTAAGVYGHIPISHAFVFQGSNNDQTGVGNLDVGAFFLPMGNSTAVLRAGIALPTASDDLNGAITNFLSTYERITDVVLTAPNYTSVRFSASTLQEMGTAFFRGDLGLDLAVDKPNSGNRAFVRANVALGARTAMVDLAAELVTVGSIDGSAPLDQRFFHTLALGLRTRGADQLHFGTVFPLDADARGEVWILSLGYQRAMY